MEKAPMAKAMAAKIAPTPTPIARNGRLRDDVQTRSMKRSHDGTVRHSNTAKSNCATRIQPRWKNSSNAPISAI